jgi:hypothetical protein
VFFSILVLLQLRSDAVEGRVEFRADSAQNGNQTKGNESGDQAILNGSGAGIVLGKVLEELGHVIFIPNNFTSP